jgi:Zn-dependent protease
VPRSPPFRAAIGCAAIYAVTQQPIWAALTHTGALLNLFNLIPVWQLDGGRAFNSLTRRQRWLAIAVIATAWVLTEHILQLALLVFATARTVMSPPSKDPDSGALWQYNALVVALSVLMQFPELVGAKIPR